MKHRSSWLPAVGVIMFCLGFGLRVLLRTDEPQHSGSKSEPSKQRPLDSMLDSRTIGLESSSPPGDPPPSEKDVAFAKVEELHSQYLGRRSEIYQTAEDVRKNQDWTNQAAEKVAKHLAGQKELLDFLHPTDQALRRIRQASFEKAVRQAHNAALLEIASDPELGSYLKETYDKRKGLGEEGLHEGGWWPKKGTDVDFADWLDSRDADSEAASAKHSDLPDEIFDHAMELSRLRLLVETSRTWTLNRITELAEPELTELREAGRVYSEFQTE